MNQHFVPALLAVAAATILTGPAAGGVVWNEAVSGDLPDLYRFSDPVTASNNTMNLGALAFGGNTLLGTNIQESSGFGNRFEGDAVRFTVPAGLQLSEIIVDHDRAAGLREFLRVSASSCLLYTSPSPRD